VSDIDVCVGKGSWFPAPILPVSVAAEHGQDPKMRRAAWCGKLRVTEEAEGGAMGEYAEIGAQRIWYEALGQGDPLVLLNGGLCTNETWAPQLPALAERFRVFALEQRAHGHTPDPDGPLTYEDTATDVIGFIETVVGGSTHVLGFSDGGITALHVAVARPDLIRKLVTTGTNFDTAGMVAEAEQMASSMTPDSEDMAMFRSLYEAATPDGPEHWPMVVKKILEMWSVEPHIPVTDLARIVAPTLVLVGDDDMVRLEHAVEMYRSIPNAELAVVPGASHMVAMEKPDLFNGLVLDFLTKEPVSTMLPFRRAPADHH
jgi:pimeloyl-ACP methyl ester carboxylesterase